MEPSIRYARTQDGVKIAFWTLGEGEPLVYMAGGPWNHIELWQVPECRRWYERLARHRMLVRYDMRGTGSSERNVPSYSLESLVSDVEAVVDQLGLGKFSLFGAADAGPVAMQFAVRHPERVSRLVLWCAWARSADVASPRLQAWRGLIDQDWELMTDTCAYLALGWSAGEVGRRAAQYLRESVSQPTARLALAAIGQFDVTDILSKQTRPALILQRRSIDWLPVDVGRRLAAGMPNGRLVLVDGESTAPYLGDTEPVARVIDEFLETSETVVQALPSGEIAPTNGGERQAGRRRGHPDRLTEREVEVLRLLASGRTNNEIAEFLTLSVRTVERHVENIYAKIGARRRVDATAYALTRGLL